MANKKTTSSIDQLILENEELRSRLAKAEETLTLLNGKGNLMIVPGKPVKQDGTKEDLHESEKRLTSVYSSMSDGLAIHELIYDATGKPVDYIITEVNPAFENITGLNKKTCVGKKATEAYSVSEAPYLDIYAKVGSTGIPESFETYFAPMEKHFSVSVFSPGKGKFATIFQDITERKLISDTQNFLLQSGYPGSGEDFFKSLARFLAGILGMDYVCIDKLEGDSLSAETLAIFCDDKFDPNVSYTLKETPCGEVVGKTICCFPHNVSKLFPNDQALQDLKAESYVGTTLWSYEGKPIGLIAIIGRKPLYNTHLAEVVIKLAAIRAAGELELKNADNALRESEGRFKTIAETVPVLVCITRIKDSVVMFTNEVNNKAFGLRGEDIIGSKGEDYYCDPADRERMITLLKEQGAVNNFQIKVKKNDGTPFWIMTSVRPIIYNGHPAIIGASIDITDSKKIEQELRLSEERFRNIIKYAPAVIYEMDMHGTKFVTVNDTMCNILGYSREELIMIRPVDLLDESSRLSFIDRVKRRLEGQRIKEDIEYRVRRKDGEWIDTLITVSNIAYAAGTVPNITVIAYDITERKRMEAKLRESEKKFRELVKYAPTAIYELDFLSKRFTAVNDAMCQMSGYSREELLSINVLDILDNESKLLFLNRIKSCLKGEQPDDTVEYRVKAKSGQIINVVLGIKFNYNKQGIPVGAMVVGHDITRRKLAEEELRESEERFRTLAGNIPDMIVRFDKDLRLLYGNQAVINRTGLPLESLLGKTAMEYGNASVSAKNFEKISRDVLVSGKPIRLQQENHWQGVTQVYDALLVPEKDINGKVSSIISIARDITEMKHAESTLRNSEQRLKYHLENSPLAVVEWDRDFKIIQWSDEAERIFGLKKDEALGIRIDHLNIIYEEDIPIVEKTISRLISGKELKVISQNRNLTKSGEIIDCIWYNSVLLDENGEMSSVMSLVEDITILRRTEKELLESRESYRELVTNARSIIVKLDNDGKFTFVNEFAQSFFGFKKKDLLGRSVLETIIPKKESSGRDLEEMAEKIIDDPDKYSVNINENIKKNGDRVWVEWHNKTLFDQYGNKAGFIAIGIDITSRKRAEEELKESEGKLWSVLDATPESIYMFDKDGIICMSNSTGLQRLKCRDENEVIGHHFSEFMNRETSKHRQEMLDEVFSKGLPVEFEDERDCRIYHHNFFPVFKNSKVRYVVTYSSDITDRKKSESKLLESEDRFRTIAESLPVMISITRVCDLVITFVNEPYKKSFGFNGDDLTGKKLPDIFCNPLDRDIVYGLLKKTGFVDNREIKVKKSNGTAFWIITSIRKINFLGESSYLESSIDITETKKAHEDLLRLNRTLDAHSKSSHAMMHSDNELNYLNEVCRIITEDCGHSMVWVGYAEKDNNMSVKPVAYYGFDQGYIDQMNISWDDTERGRGPTGTAIRTGKPSLCRNMLTDPAFVPWRQAAIERGFSSSLVLPLIAEGEPFGAISIYSREPDSFSDSEIKLLSGLADDLAYGISFIRLTESEREAARAVKENEAKLKELVATKDKFFNIVAHDLKNPFTSLLGSSELLYDNIDKMTAENVRKLALILNDSAKGGYAILQNLLDWSRSQTGLLKFHPEKMNLKTIIDENIDNLQLQVNNKGIKLRSELTEDLFICADKNMINTVLRNLLSNAVKYTYKNGKVVVDVSQNPEEIMLTVSDSGIGITKEKVDTLFKIENALSLPGTEKEQGTGLGLKLCKEFTERMGGRIWVESADGKGSKFRFTIPLKS